MSMNINLVKQKPKGINIEYHGSDTSGVCTLVWYYLNYFTFFFPVRDLFSISKTRCRIKQKSPQCTCNPQPKYVANGEAASSTEICSH